MQMTRAAGWCLTYKGGEGAKQKMEEKKERGREKRRARKVFGGRNGGGEILDIWLQNAKHTQ